MSFYKTHAPRHREHTRPLPDFVDLEGMRALQEEKEIPAIRVLDYPDIAEKKSAPSRSIIVLASTLLSAMAACMWILISDARKERAVAK